MFQLYLYNWAKDFNVLTEKYTLVSAETLALSIPVNSPDDIWLTNPVIKAEVNKAESFDFSLDTGSPYYNAFIPYKTWIRIVYDQFTIFWGQVKTINNSTILQKRSIHAEGVYTVFSDTPVEGLEEDLQPNVTARTQLESLINSHNAYIEEPYKKFRIRNITANLSTEGKKRGSTSWTTTMSELDNLIEENGGYVRAVYNDNHATNGEARNYLDWTKYYFRDLGDGKRPAIKLTKNLIDISKGTENNEIFTRVIPIGHRDTSTETTTTSKNSKNKTESSFVYLSGSKFIRVSEVSVGDEFRSPSDFANAESNYGVIYKTVTFQNASDSSTLRTYCLDWIKNNFFGIVHNFSVKALDMHMLGERESQILVGDCVDIIYPEFDNDGTPHEISRKVICKAIQYNLLNPESNSYTLGIPCDPLDFEYGTKSKKKNKSANKGAANMAEQQRVSSGSASKPATISHTTIEAWLKHYYYSIRKEYIVDWTETRWVKYGPNYSVNPSDYTEYRDTSPYKTWRSNGEYKRVIRIESGIDSATGDKLYTEETNYTYGMFKRPDGSGSVRGRIMGHYTISSTTKPEANHKSGYDYGVCVTDDGHVYTFTWSLLNRVIHQGNLESYQFATWFEITQSTVSRRTTDEIVIEANNTPTTDQEVRGDTTWTSYPYTDPETGETLYKTTSMIAGEEGWAAFGFVTGDNGELIPSVKLNDKVTYTDKDGNTVTKEGFVTAQDLNLPEIPSFTTKIAVIDNLIVEKAAIKELRAAVAILGGDRNYSEDSYEIDPKTGQIKLDENGNWKLKEGTTLYTNASNIVGASGLYYTKEYYDANGNLQKDLVIKDGAGLKVDKNGSSYGVWDEGNLTGGIMVQKINGQTETLINGDHINIGDGKTQRILTSAVDEYEQLVGEHSWQTVSYRDENGKLKQRKVLLGLSAGAQIWDSGKNASFGIYHNGNLDGGVMVRKINTETKTTIKGDHIEIGNKSSKTVSLKDSFTINQNGYIVAQASMWITGDLTVGGATSGSDPKLTAKLIHVGTNGSLIFDNRNATLSFKFQDAQRLRDTATKHIKVVKDSKNDSYSLYYLPVLADPNVDANWLNCGNFNSAPTLSGSWDGGSGTNPAYLYMKSAASQKSYFTLRFGSYVGNTANQHYEIVNEGEDSTYFVRSTKKIRANVGLVQRIFQGSETRYVDVHRYGQVLYFDATPAWNDGWNLAGETAAKQVALPKIKENSNTIAVNYPVWKSYSKKIEQDTVYYSIKDRDDDTVVLCDDEDDVYAKWKHGKYTAGRNYEKSVMYTSFGQSGGQYYAFPIERTDEAHSVNLGDGKKVYKLGMDSGGTKVQIQDSSGSKISYTPEFTMNRDISIRKSGSFYILEPKAGAGKGADYIYFSLSSGDLNVKTGKRTIKANILAYGYWDNSGSYTSKTYDLSATIDDYGYGVAVGKAQGNSESHHNSATFLCRSRSSADGGRSYSYVFGVTITKSTAVFNTGEYCTFYF